MTPVFLEELQWETTRASRKTLFADGLRRLELL
jgi:hypothetical protein